MREKRGLRGLYPEVLFRLKSSGMTKEETQTKNKSYPHPQGTPGDPKAGNTQKGCSSQNVSWENYHVGNGRDEHKQNREDSNCCAVHP